MEGVASMLRVVLSWERNASARVSTNLACEVLY
jgi:hypothetical protein